MDSAPQGVRAYPAANLNSLAIDLHATRHILGRVIAQSGHNQPKPGMALAWKLFV